MKTMQAIYFIGRNFGMDLGDLPQMNLYDMFPFPTAKGITYSHKKFQSPHMIQQNMLPTRINQRYHNNNSRKTNTRLCKENKKQKIQKVNKLERNAYWDSRLKSHSKNVKSGRGLKKYSTRYT